MGTDTPIQYRTVSPYLVVRDAARVIAFLEGAFGGRELNRHAAEDGRIMHAEVQLGDSIVMIGESPDPGRAGEVNLQIFVEDTDASYRRALDAGGTSEAEPADKPYGTRMAGVADPAGNHWWIGTRWA
jgi:uncharacterized glyoxalase superfamily protein PhnB